MLGGPQLHDGPSSTLEQKLCMPALWDLVKIDLTMLEVSVATQPFCNFPDLEMLLAQSFVQSFTMFAPHWSPCCVVAGGEVAAAVAEAEPVVAVEEAVAASASDRESVLPGSECEASGVSASSASDDSSSSSSSGSSSSSSSAGAAGEAQRAAGPGVPADGADQAADHLAGPEPAPQPAEPGQEAQAGPRRDYTRKHYWRSFKHGS